MSCNPLPTEGYDLDYVEPPPDSLICPICLLPFRDPHLLSCCGAKFCQSCIGRVSAAGQPCPLCKQPFDMLVERNDQRKVLNLKVRCSRKRDGCEWEGELRHLEKHEREDCGWALVQCRYHCGENVIRHQLMEHEHEECPQRPVEMKLESSIRRMTASFTTEVDRQIRTHREEMVALVKHTLKDELKGQEELKSVKEDVKELRKEVGELRKEMGGLRRELEKSFREQRTALVMEVGKVLKEGREQHKGESEELKGNVSCHENAAQVKLMVKEEIKKEVAANLSELKPNTATSHIVEFPDGDLSTNQPLEFTVLLQDQAGRPSTGIFSAVILAELLPSSENRSSSKAVIHGKVTKLSVSSVKISFSPPLLRGRHTLSVLLNDEHIAGSPRDVFLHHPVKLLGEEEPWCISFENSPWSVAVSPVGKVYISVETKIYVYAHNGDPDVKLEPNGLGSIGGMAVDDEGSIYITDSGHRVNKLDAKGALVAYVGGPGRGADRKQFNLPNGVAFSLKTGLLYVCDTFNHRIQVLNKKLEVVRDPIRQDGGQAFGFCKGITVDSETGNLFITEHNNHRVRVLSPEGEHILVFGDRGTIPGTLSSPHGISVSGEHIFIADLSNSRVSIFNKHTGNFVHCFGQKAQGALEAPAAVAVDGDGFVYVCDTGRIAFLRSTATKCRVLVF